MRQLLRDEWGNALVFGSVSLPLMIGFMGLATDVWIWTLDKKDLQRIADTAAMSGGYALKQNYDSQDGIEAAEEAVADLNQLFLVAAPDITSAPSKGKYAGDSRALRVELKTKRDLPFSDMFVESPIITTQATVALGSDLCVVSLDRSTSVGIAASGDSSVGGRCGMFANSESPSNAIQVSGNASLDFDLLGAVGGIPDGDYNNAVVEEYQPPVLDPFAGLANPTVGACGEKTTVKPTDNVVLSPGCYRGLEVTGVVHFQPGTYIIDGGKLSFGAIARATGNGVVFILTSATAASDPSSVARLEMIGGATLDLSAPTTGAYQGVLFYQDRRSALRTGLMLSGNNTARLTGAVYLPRTELTLTGNVGFTGKCIRLIAHRLQFSGNATINVRCSKARGDPIDGRIVRLVD